jgi:hypothetical protein
MHRGPEQRRVLRRRRARVVRLGEDEWGVPAALRPRRPAGPRARRISTTAGDRDL